MLSFHGSTSDKDTGEAELLRQVEEFKKADVSTGLFEGEKHPGTEYTVAQIGAVHEFGSEDGRVPERSWLRRSFRENVSRWQHYVEQGLERIILSKGKVKALPVLLFVGEQIASDVRRTIDAVTSPPKAASTLRKEGKKYTHPLIWLGYMKAAVRSRVVVDGAKKLTSKGARR